MTIKKKLKNNWKRFAESPRAKKFRRILRRVIIAVILGIIVYQLYLIGWRDVLNFLPTQPLFYVLFFVLYLTLPTCEIFIYRKLWPLKRRKLFQAMLTKKIYNDEIIGYSGEVYLFTWARKYLEVGDKQILKDIRDNSILSAITSNLVAFLLVGVLVYTGIVDISSFTQNVNIFYVVLGILIAAIFIILFIQFRKYLFALPLKKAIVIFTIYLTRFLLHHGLLIVQWAIVIPGTSLSTWFTFLAITIVVNRIPFLPSKDLLFMWAGIELSRALSMTTAAVAGMLLVTSALKKVTNLVLVLAVSYISDAPDIRQIRNQENITDVVDEDLQNKFDK